LCSFRFDSKHLVLFNFSVAETVPNSTDAKTTWPCGNDSEFDNAPDHIDEPMPVRETTQRALPPTEMTSSIWTPLLPQSGLTKSDSEVRVLPLGKLLSSGEAQVCIHFFLTILAVLNLDL